MDVSCYRVPNILILIGILSGVLIHFQKNGYYGILQGIAGILVPILILYPFFIIRGIGAGDIKLFSVIGSFLSIKETLICIGVALFFGAILSLIKMIIHKNLVSRMQYLASYILQSISSNEVALYHKGTPDRKSVIPFSIPILISVLLHSGGIY